MTNAYLITGKPGTGKTTAVKAIVDALGADRCGGFYTEEVRIDGERTGFRIVTLDGRSAMLADINATGDYRVGKYGVLVEEFERIAIPAIRRAINEKEWVVIDEIGPMELFSEAFKQAVAEVLANEKNLLGTIVQRHHGWADELKKNRKVELVTLTIDNRDRLTKELIDQLA